ncbi:MAG: NAD-dependent epimerase/dehydratase family protein [Solirubrobacterales bacterium]
MRALVTGGAGFIGSNLVDALVARGDEVVVIDDLSSGRRENLAGALDAGAELIEASIADPGALAGAFERLSPQLVFHLAAQIDVRRSVTEPVYDLSLNVGATIHLLEAARQAGTARFLFASTGGAIYGEGAGRELPLPEAAAALPDAPYGQSKLAAEGYLGLYSRLYGLSTVSLRLGNVYGPRQDPHGEAGVVAIFSSALLEGGQTKVFGDGEQTRDYVYVADVVSAFLAAAASDVTGPLNVGTGIETSVLELGVAVAELCGRPFEPEVAPHRAGEVQRIAIDAARAEAELGWRPAFSLSEGLQSTVDSFRS